MVDFWLRRDFSIRCLFPRVLTSSRSTINVQILFSRGEQVKTSEAESFFENTTTSVATLRIEITKLPAGTLQRHAVPFKLFCTLLFCYVPFVTFFGRFNFELYFSPFLFGWNQNISLVVCFGWTNPYLLIMLDMKTSNTESFYLC